MNKGDDDKNKRLENGLLKKNRLVNIKIYFKIKFHYAYDNNQDIKNSVINMDYEPWLIK